MTDTSLSLGDFRLMLEKARDGRQMLSLLTEPKNAQALVRSMSTDDLYLCLQMVGVGDSETVLALASGKQVQGLIDIDCWQGDEVVSSRIQPWLQSLMRAGPEVLTKRMLDLDDALLMHVLRSHVDAYVVEDPDDFEPPSEMHVFTPDNQTCLVFKADQENSLPIRLFLDTLMRFDAAHCLNLLAHINSSLLSNLEEQAYRWRSGRLADKGYVDYYEALKIYAPLPAGYMYARPNQQEAYEPTLRSKALIAQQSSNNLLERAVAAMDEQALERFHYETTLAANMALSADRTELWDAEGQHEVLVRVRKGLELGLAMEVGPDAATAALAAHLESKGAIQVFRAGYQAIQNSVATFNRLVRRQRFRDPSGRLGAIDLPLLLSWAERLSARHPTTESGTIPSDLGELQLLKLWNKRLCILGELAKERPLEAGILAWIWTQFLRSVNELTTLTPSALITLSHELVAQKTKRETLAKDFSNWFQRTSKETDDVLIDQLFEAAFDELLSLSSGDLPEDVTPQFIYFENA